MGFTVTEAVAKASDVLAIEVTQTDLGILADIKLQPGAIQRKARPRTLEGRSSCGLCGVQRLADAVRPLPRLEHGATVSHQAVQHAVDALGDAQALGRLTRATHAAAFADAQGTLVVVREDVGRHNALDKLAGAMARGGATLRTASCWSPAAARSRWSRRPCGWAARSWWRSRPPPTWRSAGPRRSGLTLVALARADGHTVFTYPERLLDVAPEYT